MPNYQTIYLLKADNTHYPQTPRDDNDKDKYTQKDKYKDKDARNSSVPVLMYIGCNALWLISFVHQYKDKYKDKDKDKEKDKDKDKNTHCGTHVERMSRQD